MSNTKAIIDFSGYAAGNLAPAAQNVVDKLFGNVNFPTPPIMQATLQTKINDFIVALADKAGRATAKVIAFNLVRHDLEGMLADLGGYVNDVANGDLAIVDGSGFPYYTSGQPADNSPPAAPADVVLRHGDLSGSVVIRFRSSRPRSASEVQKCVGDPNVEDNWQYTAICSGGKATIGSLTVGSTVWFRIRTAGLKGVMGAWSDPAKITVI